MYSIVCLAAGLGFAPVAFGAELTFPTVVRASTTSLSSPYNMTLAPVPFGNGYNFNTRGYNGGVPGPTFEMDPGQTMYINLTNSLSNTNNVACTVTAGEFCQTATTNLHTHGLHITAKGKEDGLSYYSDDVFADVVPGETQNFQFTIPDYHMGGTHWYHPHHHHATALQAGGGAAGAYIVTDPAGYLPTAYASMQSKVLFMSGHNLNTLQTMAVSSQSTLLTTAATTATAAGLATNVILVNGQLQPTMTINSHTWYRMRMLFAAVEQQLELFVSGNASCSLKLIAKDGVYMHTFPRDITNIFLHPGARADVCIACTCTTYPCQARIDSVAGGGAAPKGPAAPRRAAASQPLAGDAKLGETPVRAGSPPPKQAPRPRRLQGTKPPPGEGRGMGGTEAAPTTAQAGVTVDATVMFISVTETVGGSTTTLPVTTVKRPCYVADLRQATVPTANKGVLAMNGGARTVTYGGTGNSMTYANVHANGGTKATWPPITTFQSGQVYEIDVTGAAAHPWHIHINPFQITTANLNYGGGYFQTGDWHDVLMISELQGNLGIRMQTDRFTGKMVTHCHILEHEDEGMMAFIQIDGTEGATYNAEALDSTCYRTAFNSATMAPVTNGTSSFVDQTTEAVIDVPPTPSPTAASPTPASAPAPAPVSAPTAAPGGGAVTNHATSRWNVLAAVYLFAAVALATLS